jgi:hypothetical protein
MKCPAGVELAIVLIIGIVVLTCGCASPGPAGTGADTLPVDRYVALYEENDTIGSVPAGNVTIAYMPVPCPRPLPFDYNGTLGYSGQYPEVNDDLKVMYGSYVVVDHPAGGYSTACYRGIYELPFTLDSGLKIWGIDAAGTINASYYDANVTLKVGDVWKSMLISIVKNESLHIIGDNITFGNFVYQPFTVQYNYSWTIENKGMFPKANITG